MLVLTRKEGERILIGKDNPIEVKVIRVNGNRVQLGVTAVRSLPVHRAEVAEKIAESEAA